MCEQAVEPQSGARGDEGASGQPGAGDRDQHPKCFHHACEPTVRLPTEPPDDAALGIVQRLHLAGASRRWLGREAQALEAGATFDEAKPAVLEAVAVAEHSVNLVEGKPQCRVPFNASAAVVPRDEGEADQRADHDRSTQGQQEKRGDMGDDRGR